MIKSLIPRWLRCRISAFRTSRSQLAIVAKASTKNRVLLEPVNNVEHYYHFLYDLAMPLWRLMRASPESVTYLIPEFGIYSPRLKEIFGNRVEVVQPTELASARESKFPLYGYNPVHVHVTSTMLLEFREFVFERLKVSRPSSRNKVLVIERLFPDAYFLTEAKKRGAGATRRSIANHEQVLATISRLCGPEFQVKNLQLEKLGFEEQVRIFREARVIIGQHGAGLGNCLWADSDTSVLEISNSPELDHFKIISGLLNQKYGLYRANHPHATINLNYLSNTLRTSPNLASVFTRSFPNS